MKQFKNIQENNKVPWKINDFIDNKGKDKLSQFEILVKQNIDLKLPNNEKLSENLYRYFYKFNFWKNNRWNKKHITSFYNNLDIELRKNFKSVFLKCFNINKTNTFFIDTVNHIDNAEDILINKNEFSLIIDAIAFLKKEGTISMPYKSIAKALKKGFTTEYSVVYIEDKLRLKNIDRITSIESRIKREIIRKNKKNTHQ